MFDVRRFPLLLSPNPRRELCRFRICAEITSFRAVRGTTPAGYAKTPPWQAGVHGPPAGGCPCMGETDFSVNPSARNAGLTRTSHQLSAAVPRPTRDRGYAFGLRHGGARLRPDRAGVLSRKPRIQNHLGSFASRAGEKSGQAYRHHSSASTSSRRPFSGESPGMLEDRVFD